MQYKESMSREILIELGISLFRLDLIEGEKSNLSDCLLISDGGLGELTEEGLKGHLDNLNFISLLSLIIRKLNKRSFK